MSDEPDEINKYIRINRAELISDVNMSLGGSLSLSATNPIQQSDGAYLDSRVGGSDRLPTPGYVLKFDSTNPSAFIQTVIPSSERDNYNIIIKGEGTIDVLYVDTTGTNIAIKQKQSLTGSDYFDLSYIAFVDRTSSNITHLFECEENGGLLLYDAFTGDTATITNETSLSSLRASASSKELIKDEGNLGNEVDFVSGYASKASFTQNIPDELSICFELENNINLVNIASTTPLIQIQTGGLGASTNTGISFEVYDRTPYPDANPDNRLYLNIRTTSGASNYNTYKRVVELFDGNKHKFAFILSKTNGNIKIAVDGTVNNNYTFTPSASFTWNSFDDVARTINIGNDAYKSNWENIKFFNFDISANDAPYTLQDYQNGKDVSSNLISGLDVIPVEVSNVLYEAQDRGKLTNPRSYSISYSNGVWTYTTTEAGELKARNSYYWFTNYPFSGSIIEFSIGDWTATSSSDYFYVQNMSLRYEDGTYSANISIRKNSTYKIVASKPVKAIRLGIYAGPDHTVGDYLEVTGLKIKVNGTLVNLNNATPTTLLDSSLNNNSLTLSGTTELPNKNYGTWCNAVGYNEDNGINIPRKVLA